MTQGGAAQFAAGDELAGEDGVPALSAPRDVTPPAAILFNGATFTFPYLASGLLTPLDPTDQQVALALLIRKGTLASVPALGATFREIRKIDRYTTAKVTDAVNLALASLIASKAIVVLSITVETQRTNGRIVLAVAYRNLRTTPQRPTTVQINLT